MLRVLLDSITDPGKVQGAELASKNSCSGFVSGFVPMAVAGAWFLTGEAMGDQAFLIGLSLQFWGKR